MVKYGMEYWTNIPPSSQDIKWEDYKIVDFISYVSFINSS